MPVNKLLNKNFVLLFQGQLVSNVGTFIYAAGFIFWLKNTTESTAFVGLFTMASALPGVLLGLFGGAIADRYSRKLIILLGDLINGLLTLVTATAMFLLPDYDQLIMVLLFLNALSMSIVGAFFRPAVSASIPDLVPSDKINSANGMLLNSIQVGSLIGMTIGGVLYRLLGAPVLMLINGITYLFSAFSEFFITIPQKKQVNAVNKKKALKQLKLDVVDGFRYVRRSPGLQDLFLIYTIWYFFTNAMSILLPFFVEDVLLSTPDWFGFLMAGFSCGVLLGSSLAATIKISPSKKLNWVTAAFSLLGLSIVGLAYSPNEVVALLITIVRGVCTGYASVIIVSAMQLTTLSEFRGRVLGLLDTATLAMAPIAMGISGVIADILNQDIKLIFLVSGLCIVLASFNLFFSRGARELLSYEDSNSKHITYSSRKSG